MTVRLTDAQRQLLEEIQEAGVLYIGRYKRYGRTVRALEDRGLVHCTEPDYSTHAHDGWSLTADGDVYVWWLASASGVV